MSRKVGQNPGNIRKMTSETDVFSVAGMWITTQQMSHYLAYGNNLRSNAIRCPVMAVLRFKPMGQLHETEVTLK